MKSASTILVIFFLFISLGCEGAFEQTEYDFDYGEVETENVETSEVPTEQAVVQTVENPVEEQEEVIEEEVVEEEPIEEEEVPDPNARPEPGSVVTFEIPAGTGDNAWNSFETPVVAYVGQVLLIVNQDSETHQLHAGGDSALNHGQPMGAGGGAQEFELTEASSLRDSTPFYDHLDGGRAGFWIEIRP